MKRHRLTGPLLALLFAAALGTLPGVAGATDGPPEAPAGSPTPTGSITPADSTTASHRIIAYYFHTTQRCVSCRKLEAFTTEAIQTGFPEELKDGRLVFRAVNVEEKGNEHFVKEYQIYTKSVVLVDERSGKQVAWKNLPKIWELLVDRTKFMRYVQAETRGYLMGRQS